MFNAMPRGSEPLAAPAETMTPVPPVVAPRLSRARRAAIALFLFAAAILVRLPAFRTSEPNPDERHWVSRSALILARFDAGSYGVLTSHLRHPGIPAAVAMAVGQRAASLWNTAQGAQPGSRYYVDQLAASRLANALVSSLLFPVLFLALVSIFPIGVAITAPLLLLLECQHAALSRVAHIDGVLAMLSGVALCLFIAADRSQRLLPKLLAGFAWGLAIATKPTALFLIPILLAYKALSTLQARYSGSSRTPSVVSWSDIWAVIVGFVTLGSIFTYLWDPHTVYATVRNINPRIVFYFAAGAEQLHALPLVALCLIVLTAFSATATAWLYRRGQQSERMFHYGMGAATLGTLAILIAMFPITAQNLVRLGGNIVGLRARTHQAYGMTWRPAGSGYTEIWIRHLSEPYLAGLLLGTVCLLRAARKRGWRRLLAEEPLAPLIGCLILVPFLWTLPLSFSSKQTVRYALAAFAAVAVLAALGYAAAARWISELWISEQGTSEQGMSELRRSKRRPGHRGTFVFGCCAIPVLVQAVILVKGYPDWSNYFSGITGGFRAAQKRGFSLGVTRYYPALQYLQDVSSTAPRRQVVEVIGDMDLMQYAYRRITPEEKWHRLRFMPYQGASGSDWLLVFPYIQQRQNIYLDPNRLELIQEKTVAGVPAWRLYRVRPSDVPVQQTLQIRFGRWFTGRLNSEQDGDAFLYAHPASAHAGYFLFDVNVRLQPGRYSVQWPLTIYHPDEFDERAFAAPVDLSAVPADSDVIRLEFGDECQRVVKLSELMQPGATFATDCEIRSSEPQQLRAYWFGRVPVELHDLILSIQRSQ